MIVVVSQVQASMLTRGLQLVGWYHSHPASEARPSENDVRSHQRYQEAMLSGESGIPCVALITSKASLFCDLTYNYAFKNRNSI